MNEPGAERVPRKVSLLVLRDGPAARGIPCPACGAAGAWSISDTIREVNAVRRRRYCRCCGTVSITREKLVGPASYQPPLPAARPPEESEPESP